MFPEIIGENYHCLALGLRSNFNKLIERRSNEKNTYFSCVIDVFSILILQAIFGSNFNNFFNRLLVATP